MPLRHKDIVSIMSVLLDIEEKEKFHKTEAKQNNVEREIVFWDRLVQTRCHRLVRFIAFGTVMRTNSRGLPLKTNTRMDL